MTRAAPAPLTGPVALRIALSCFAILALYSGAAQYWHAALGGPRPLYSVVLLVAGAVAVLALEPHRPTRVLGSPLLVWAYLYLLLSTASALWRTVYGGHADQALDDRFRSVALLVALSVLFDDHRARAVARAGVVVIALLAAASNLAETFGAVTFVDSLERTAGRAGGLHGNPNQSGFVIVFGLAAGIGALPRALRLPALLLGACGVAATFSRSALLCLGILAAVLAWRGEVSARLTALAAGGAAAAFVLTGGRLEALLDATGALNRDTLSRLRLQADDSGRAALAGKAWRAFLEAPWVGQGLGSQRGGRMSHNMYLSLAADHGVLGLAAFPALVVAIVARNREALAFGLAFLVAGFFGHGFLEQEPGLLCAALAAARPPSAPAAAIAGDPGPAVS